MSREAAFGRGIPATHCFKDWLCWLARVHDPWRLNSVNSRPNLSGNCLSPFAGNDRLLVGLEGLGCLFRRAFPSPKDSQDSVPSTRLPAPFAPHLSLAVFAVEFQLNLDSETVADASPSKAVELHPDDSIRHVMRVLKQTGSGAAMICQQGRLAGIFTERDALQCLVDGTNLDSPISTVMISEPVTVQTDDSLNKAILLMSTREVRRLPVLNADHQVLGVLTASDILHFLVGQFPKIVYTLPPAPHHKMNEREGA